MSKFVKELIRDHLKAQLDGVTDLVTVNMVGVSANNNSALRKELRAKNIHVLVVKNSLARRATENSALAPAFEGSVGMTTLVWGSTDVVALAKEVTRLAADKKYAPFSATGGVMGGTALTAADVGKVSKWPSREEQLSILLGQILSPGATLSGQLLAGGGALASQIKQLSEREPEAGAAEAPAGRCTSCRSGSCRRGIDWGRCTGRLSLIIKLPSLRQSFARGGVITKHAAADFVVGGAVRAILSNCMLSNEFQTGERTPATTIN